MSISMEKRLTTKDYKIKTRFSAGFTMVELLVYIVVFSFISILAVNMFLSISSAFVEIRGNHELARSGGAVLEKMTREIKWANTIDASSTLGTAPSTLILNGTDLSGTARTTTFAVSNGDLIFSEGGTSVGSLLSGSVSVDSFLIREITTSVSSAVRIELTLSYERGSTTRTENFYTTVSLRGGY